MKFTITGNTGHALRFIENTAAEKLQTVINKMLDFRKKEKQRLESDPSLGLGDVTSVNMTIIEVRSQHHGHQYHCDLSVGSFSLTLLIVGRNANKCRPAGIDSLF